MPDRFSRSRILIGERGLEKLKNAYIAVFGVGGVGGYVVEALVRSGIGAVDIFDHDKISITNINRQIIALTDNIGKYKVEVMRERALSINPDLRINAHKCFYMPENADEYDFSKYSYIVDAVDTVTAKIEIIMRANAAGTPVISSMGTGNKLDASRLEVTDIYKTSVCPLARVMRYELKKRNVKNLKVVYSKETPIKPEETGERRAVPGSMPFVPAAAGLIIAGEVVRDLIQE